MRRFSLHIFGGLSRIQGALSVLTERRAAGHRWICMFTMLTLSVTALACQRWFFSRGYSKVSGEVDHVITQYIFNDVPLVTAEGGWAMADGYGLDIQYTVNFEHGTARFIFDATNNLTLFQLGKSPYNVALASDMGYVHEIAYFLDCVSDNRAPRLVTFRDTAHAIVICEAEGQSIASKKLKEIKENR